MTCEMSNAEVIKNLNFAFHRQKNSMNRKVLEPETHFAPPKRSSKEEIIEIYTRDSGSNRQ
jgi:hypothetical protein